MKRGKILEWQRFPSPHPTISLYVVTYLNDGLKIKGLAAIPAGKGPFPGFLYLRGGIKSVGMVQNRTNHSICVTRICGYGSIL